MNKNEALETEAIKMMLSQKKLNEEGLALRLYLIIVIETFKSLNKKVKTNYNKEMIANLEKLTSDYDKAFSENGLINDEQFAAMKKSQLDIAKKVLYPTTKQTKKKK